MRRQIKREDKSKVDKFANINKFKRGINLKNR